MDGVQWTRGINVNASAVRNTFGVVDDMSRVAKVIRPAVIGTRRSGVKGGGERVRPTVTNRIRIKRVFIYCDFHGAPNIVRGYRG